MHLLKALILGRAALAAVHESACDHGQEDGTCQHLLEGPRSPALLQTKSSVVKKSSATTTAKVLRPAVLGVASEGLGHDRPDDMHQQLLMRKPSSDQPTNQRAVLEQTPASRPNESAVQPTVGRLCSAPESLRNVTLVLHCRASQQICQSRQPLLQTYRQYFKDVTFLVNWPAEGQQLPRDTFACREPGDPYMCVTEVMKAIGDSAGLLYMHFDAVLSPCTFADRFDAAKVGTFNSREQLSFVTFDLLDRCNLDALGPYGDCHWDQWDVAGEHEKRRQLVNTATDLKKAARKPDFPADGAKADVLYDQMTTGVWGHGGFDDFFYLPRRAFDLYAAQAAHFANHAVFHELAGPSLLALTWHLSTLELQDFECEGNCCQQLSSQDLAAPSFRCGHPVRYQDQDARAAVEALLNRRAPTEAPRSSVAQTLLAVGSTAPVNFVWAVQFLMLVLAVLAGICAGAGSQQLCQTLSPQVLSYAICAAYVMVSVAIDLSIAVQSQSNISSKPFAFEPMCAVLLTEVVKLAVSLTLVVTRWWTEASGSDASWSTFTACDAGWFAVVAALFTLNNILVWLAIGFNDMSTFGIFRDTMILWTAALWRVVFKTPLGWGRLCGIAVVFAGLCLKEVSSVVFDGGLSLAVLLVLAMTACNAMGSVANEFAMKRRAEVDINLQNAALYSSCVGFTAVALVVTGKFEHVREVGFFSGFTLSTFFTVCLQAFAGLIISRILKYADAVQKTIAACLRGPILVVVAPLFVKTSISSLVLTSALVVATGCLLYLREGPLSATAKTLAKSGGSASSS